MAFFDELTRGIKATSQTVAQKTKEISETVQIKSQMNAEKDTIARLYEAIGKQVFESADEAAEQKFVSEFASIRSAMSKLAELEASLADMDGCILCPECGAKIDKRSRFCMKCGAPVEVSEAAEAKEAEPAEIILASEMETVVETEAVAETSTEEAEANAEKPAEEPETAEEAIEEPEV